MQTYLSVFQRQSLIDQYLDCALEVGDILEEDLWVLETQLRSYDNVQLVQQCEDTGWEFFLPDA